MHDGSGDAAPNDVAGGVLLILVAGATAAGASQTDHTGPLLAFGGALMVAALAAITAGRRQARALEAESRRLADQLAHDRELAERSLGAESARLAQQLAHDRRLSDLQHLRDLLDEAAQAYESFQSNAATLAVALTHADDAGEAYRQSVDASGSVSVMTRRLARRFPSDDPIHETYAEVRKAVDKRMEHLRGVVEKILERGPEAPQLPMTGEEDEHDSLLGAEVAVAFDRFAGAARAEIGPPR